MNIGKPTIVTAYESPDLDGFGGAIAYAEFLNRSGENARAAIFGKPHEEAQYVMKLFDFAYPETATDGSGFDRVVLVDSSELSGLHPTLKPESVIEIIDHRKVNDAHAFPNAKVQIELVGSAATLVAEKFMEHDWEPSKMSAILLYGAIVSNTLNFQAKVTHGRDRTAAAWLQEQFEIPENFVHDMFLAKSQINAENLADRIDGDFAWFTFQTKKLGMGQLEVVDAAKLVQEHKKGILAELAAKRLQHKFDYVFLNTIDLEKGFNLFVTDHIETQGILKSIFSEITFEDGVAMRKGLIMRKEIVPLFKEFADKR